MDSDGNLAKGSDSNQEITDDDSTSLGASTSKSQGKGNLGTLRGHIARANPHTKALIEAVTEAEKVGRSTGPNSAIDGDAQVQVPVSVQAQGQGQGQVLPGEALIVFTSPVEHYITPQFYSGSVGSGKVAPTWNYAAVQVYGRMVVHHKTEDSETGEFLTRQLSDLARLGEVDIMGYGNESRSGKGRDKGEGDESGQGRSPWRIADAPVEYISMLKKGIVGMEVEITRVEGRFKGSQEKGVADRDGVIGGLEKMGGWKAREMAGFVRDMSKDQKR